MQMTAHLAHVYTHGLNKPSCSEQTLLNGPYKLQHILNKNFKNILEDFILGMKGFKQHLCALQFVKWATKPDSDSSRSYDRRRHLSLISTAIGPFP